MSTNDATTYDGNTINSPNPLARFAHRTRVKNALKLAEDRIPAGRILDYGCGTGVFIRAVNERKPDTAFGYDAFLKTSLDPTLKIYGEFDEVRQHAPFATVTLFETIEHLWDDEINQFLDRAASVLEADGKVLISGPIEVGPALLLKEFNRRVVRRSKKSPYKLGELFKAAFLGQAGPRAEDVKNSHRGFDFREAIKKIEKHGWRVEVLGYSPIRFLGWYGNSQVFMQAQRAK